MAKAKKIGKIPKSVLDLRMSPKKYAKKKGIKLKGKISKREKKSNMKRLQKEYSEAAINGLNKAVKILADHPVESKKINKVRDGVDNIITNPAVMKKVAKIYKKHPDSYPNMIFLPHMIMNTLAYYQSDAISDEEKELAKDLDIVGMTKFCEKILKKQIKRYRSRGIDDAVSYQLASVIPTAKILKNGRQWYKELINKMYDVATVSEVDVDTVIKAVLKVDKKRQITRKEFEEGFYSEFILRRSSNKAKTYTDTQKELHEQLIEHTMSYLDSLKPRKLRDLLRTYIKRRKVAEEYKNDTKRVIKFTDHANSNSPYTTIKSVVQELIADNSSNELYLS